MRGIKENKEISCKEYTIAADTFLSTKYYTNFIKFRQLKKEIGEDKKIDVSQLINSNPQYYHTYVLAGNYFLANKNYKEAEANYKLALTKEVATKYEEEDIKKKIEKCESNLTK